MKNNTMLDKVIRTLSWVKDLEEGDFISSPGYTETYLDLKSNVSTNELDVLCVIVNCILILSDYNYRVCWGGGEIRPIYKGNITDKIDEDIGDDVSDLLVEVYMKRSK